MPRARISRTRRWISAVLIIAGLGALGVWGWSYARRAAVQRSENQALDRQIANRPTTPTPAAPSPALANGALIGRLSIPRLNVRGVVREGAGEDTLDVALGHIPGTALPGQPGNSGIAGHRDTLFRGLRKISKDDLIDLETAAGNYRYKVESTSIVKPQNVSVLKPGPDTELTLVTCYPFYYVGSAPDRFIVKARLVDAPVITATAPPPAPARAAAPPARRAVEPNVRRVTFQVNASHSREVAPGIRLGVVSTDSTRHRANVWMFVTADRHTIELKNQQVRQAVFFHGPSDGRQRALMLTEVSSKSVSGYLLLYGRSNSGKANVTKSALRRPRQREIAWTRQ